MTPYQGLTHTINKICTSSSFVVGCKLETYGQNKSLFLTERKKHRKFVLVHYLWTFCKYRDAIKQFMPCSDICRLLPRSSNVLEVTKREPAKRNPYVFGRCPYIAQITGVHYILHQKTYPHACTSRLV